MPNIWYAILAGIAVKATVVLGLAWFTAVLLRGRSAAARHLVWTVAAVAVLALPLLTIGLPVLRLPAMTGLLLPSAPMFTSGNSTAGPAAVPGATVDNKSALVPVKASPGYVDWRIWLMALWALGSAASFARMLAACTAIRTIRRSARPWSDEGISTALARALRIEHPVDVLEFNLPKSSPGVHSANMPMTFGVLRPFILIPANAAAWTAERRRVVLLHELAHVRRGDVATHLLARTAWCLYWWNPLAWMAWRSFVKERERAADDLVLSAGACASEYAGHLLEIARSMQVSPELECAAVAMVRRSQLEERLRAILDAGIDRTPPAHAWAVIAMLLALGLVAPLAAVRAQETPPGKAQTLPSDIDAVIRSATSQRSPEILEDVAKAAQHAGPSRNYDIALKLLQAAVALRAQISGPQSTEYGVELLKLADLEQKRHSKSADASYAEAAQVLGERPVAFHAYIRLGITALGKMDLPQALEDFQHAQRVDSGQAGLALMWMAVVRQRENKMDEAGALYLNALSQQGASSAEAGATRRLYGQFLREQGRVDEAKEVEKANVAAVRKPSAASDGVYRMGAAGVTPPSLVHKVEPEYTDEARAAKLTGTEVLYVEIGPDGRAHNPRVVQGLGLGLDENGIDAVSQWQFRPGAKDGQPATVGATIEINWRLL